LLIADNVLSDALLDSVVSIFEEIVDRVDSEALLDNKTSMFEEIADKVASDALVDKGTSMFEEIADKVDSEALVDNFTSKLDTPPTDERTSLPSSSTFIGTYLAADLPSGNTAFVIISPHKQLTNKTHNYHPT